MRVQVDSGVSEVSVQFTVSPIPKINAGVQYLPGNNSGGKKMSFKNNSFLKSDSFLFIDRNGDGVPDFIAFPENQDAGGRPPARRSPDCLMTVSISGSTEALRMTAPMLRP
ncbi:hypothetical protein ACFQEX_16930 [Roseibium salinum]|uniref:hypothetical protein n=1 Tax=Roseibium salinum TaxID=1604349 RepID=UPI00360F6EC2